MTQYCITRLISSSYVRLKRPPITSRRSHPLPLNFLVKHRTPSRMRPTQFRSSSCTDAVMKNGAAHPFSPPNLIQSASASFLAILSIKQLSGTLILLPSPHIPRPAPRTIAQANFLRLSQDDIEWSTDTIRSAQDLLFQFAIGESTGQPKWDHAPSNSNNTLSRKRFEVGEGGMYI